MILSDEDIEKISHFKDLLNHGRYASSTDVTDTYNRVFADKVNFKPLKSTNCSTCIRQRISEMHAEMVKVLDKLTC